MTLGAGAQLTVSGDVQDTVHASQTSMLSFAGKVGHDQLWFTRSNNDLVITEIGRDRGVTVADWYASNANHLAEITAGDGFSLNDGGVEALVQAMATLSPPPLGQTHLSHALETKLEPMLAANWQHA